MKLFYGEYDGQEFPTSDKLFGFNNFLDFIMEHGQQALNAMEQMMNNPDKTKMSDLLEKFLKDGMLDKDGQGRLRLTPRAIGRMQQRALMEVFSHLRQGQRQGHETQLPGATGERIEGTKPYTYGDPVSELDLHRTLGNALARHGLPKGKSRIRFDEKDFEVHLQEGTTSCSTVVLLDMSGSMVRDHRFTAAKQVAMAMQALVQSRFPLDSIDFVGFYSGAAQIPKMLLPLTTPKPVTIFDYKVRLRVPINQIDEAPQHFTNLHLGLQMARRILKRRQGENKQIFIITDGQPTAHVEGDFVYLLYPPDERSTVATLKEAVLANRQGCRIATFALIEDYWGMEWVGFVNQLTKLTKGVAFYTNSGQLGSCVMESYLSGRKKKAHIA
jgi:uncharacterized protein with von Willebrand factor type A (vWA) domain